MADDEPTNEELAVGSFDATKKKKKKKAKDGEGAADETAADLAEKVGDLKVADGGEGGVSLDFGKKKKKKKAKEGGEGEAGEEGEEGEAATDTAGGDAEEGALGEPLPLMKKKKKKKQRAEDDELPEEIPEPKAESGEAGEAAEGEEDGKGEEEGADEGDDAFNEPAGEIDLGGGGPEKLPWEGSDRDYVYEELLGRVFDILRQKNPELAGDRRRTIMRPPQVLREGTKKTVFANFIDLCKIMHRQPEHVMAFLLAELGTSGSLDGQQRLIVKGRFAPKNFEGLLRRYVTEYVMCNGCKSPDTILSKENRLYFLRCEQCGSHRSVQQIKAGFQARVGRRERTG